MSGAAASTIIASSRCTRHGTCALDELRAHRPRIGPARLRRAKRKRSPCHTFHLGCRPLRLSRVRHNYNYAELRVMLSRRLAVPVLPAGMGVGVVSCSA